MKRSISWILTCAMILLTLCSCGGQAADTPVASESPDGQSASGDSTFKLPKIKIAVAPPETSEQFATMEDYFRASIEEAKQAGLDVEIIWKAPDQVVADHIAIVEDLMQSQPDVLLFGPVDADAEKSSMNEVVEKGVPLIVINQIKPIEGVNATSYIGVDDRDAAICATWGIIDALGGPGFIGAGETPSVEPGTRLGPAFWDELYKDVDPQSVTGKVAIIEGIAGSWNSNQRVDGFYSVVDRFPNIEVVARDASNWNQLTGMEIAENYIQNFGMEGLNAVWAAGGKPGMGAVQAAVDAGVTEQLIVSTQDGTPSTIQAVIDGTLDVDVWHGFAEWGWYGAEYAVRAALGLPIPAEYNPGPSTITQANASDFYPYIDFPSVDWNKVIEDYQAANA